jgi:hypothetical protein
MMLGRSCHDAGSRKTPDAFGPQPQPAAVAHTPKLAPCDFPQKFDVTEIAKPPGSAQPRGKQ